MSWLSIGMLMAISVLIGFMFGYASGRDKKEYLDIPDFLRNQDNLADEKMVEEILKELNSARTRFPSNQHMLAALTEEVGELAQAMIDHDWGKTTSLHVKKEAVQVACMAIRVATEGDASFKKYEPK